MPQINFRTTARACVFSSPKGAQSHRPLSVGKCKVETETERQGSNPSRGGWCAAETTQWSMREQLSGQLPTNAFNRACNSEICLFVYFKCSRHPQASVLESQPPQSSFCLSSNVSRLRPHEGSTGTCGAQGSEMHITRPFQRKSAERIPIRRDVSVRDP